MKMALEMHRLSTLENVLNHLGDVAIAVSGGIDSLTLAVVACRQKSGRRVFHAVSPAVPQLATQRVKEFASTHNWNLSIIDAGEFADSSYRQNPINRCFFCKGNLYGAIAQETDLPILSGTNLDDLDDFRPGLIAAKKHGVRHPYVEAQIDKSGVRDIARHLGLSESSDLPSAPGLSRRVITGMRIDAQDLKVIDRVEEAIQPMLGTVAARCRLTEKGFHLEIEAAVLTKMNETQRAALLAKARAQLRATDRLNCLHPYQRGSAFVGTGETHAPS
jgi:uncharacterized protein